MGRLMAECARALMLQRRTAPSEGECELGAVLDQRIAAKAIPPEIRVLVPSVNASCAAVETFGVAGYFGTRCPVSGCPFNHTTRIRAAHRQNDACQRRTRALSLPSNIVLGG